MKPYHPDDSDMTYDPKKNGGKGGGKGNATGGMNVLGPGGNKNLAEDMAEGFGGTVQQWMKNIKEPYRYKFNYGGGGNGGGNGNGGGDPTADPNKPDGGFDPAYPHRMMPPAAQGAMPLGLLANPAAPQPQLGMLANQTPQPGANIQQQQLPPEILAMIRARMGG